MRENSNVFIFIYLKVYSYPKPIKEQNFDTCLQLTERYLRWLGNGAVSAHESTKAYWKNQARPKGVRPAIANNRLAEVILSLWSFLLV
jgi:hypothetical protein